MEGKIHELIFLPSVNSHRATARSLAPQPDIGSAHNPLGTDKGFTRCTVPSPGNACAPSLLSHMRTVSYPLRSYAGDQRLLLLSLCSLLPLLYRLLRLLPPLFRLLPLLPCAHSPLPILCSSPPSSCSALMRGLRRWLFFGNTSSSSWGRGGAAPEGLRLGG